MQRYIYLFQAILDTIYTSTSLVHCIWYVPTLMKISNMDIFSTTNKAFTVIFIICELCTPKTIITSYIMSIFSEVSLNSQLLFSVINYILLHLWCRKWIFRLLVICQTENAMHFIFNLSSEGNIQYISIYILFLT